MIWLEILIGAIVGTLSIWAVRRRFGRGEITFWQYGLVGAALVYVALAIIGMAWESLPLELGGLALFSVIAWLGGRYSTYLIAMGWALHIAWDQLLHPGGHPGFVPSWYPGVCLGFDIAIAVFLLLVAQQQAKKAFE